MRDGKQWTPFIDVKDVAEAYVNVIKSPKDKVSGEMFNVGSDNQNYQILQLAKEIAKALNIPFKKQWYGDPDSRSYKISFKKIKDTLGYNTKISVSSSAKEINNALKSRKTTDSLKTKTVEWYKYLLDAQKITNSVAINNKIL